MLFRSDAEFDHAMMLSWFANAIMRGYDAGRDSMTPTPPSPDSQATIAALEETILKMGENAAVVARDAMAAKEQLAALQAERDGYKTMYACLTGETYDNPIADLQSQLTQRTAELEAANKRIHDLECQHQDLCLRNQILRDRPDLPVERASFHAEVVRMQAELERVRGEIVAMRQRKDGAYLERNRVVAALASCFPSGIARTAIEGWDEEWHGCVYIDLPTGQVSWHYHDSHAHLFAHLPPYTKPWDGHTTEEKYERVVLLKHRQGMEG